jgi:predicted amidohydrolase YtcJ
MKTSNFILLSIFSLTLFMSCKTNKPNADLLVFNATIYTVDSSFSTAEAMVIDDHRILELGTKKSLIDKYSILDSMDAGGKFIYPGLIDAHAHFVGYGYALQRVNLVETKSWDEVLEKTSAFASTHPDGWLLGRGWDQNDWAVREFPDNQQLNILFPDRPVLLTRIDGHAAIANAKALELAGLQPGDTLTGGEVVTRNGQLTGLLVDNAIDRVTANIPGPNREELKKALQDAEKNCFAAGLTTIVDCGLSHETVDTIEALHESGDLRMRLYVMLSDEKKNYDYLDRRGIIKTPALHVRSFKLYGDGALGSRGACLIEPYADQPGHRGFLLSNPAHFDSVAARLIATNFQMCTHAIGDSGNRTILNIYGKYLEGKNDRRWRIEHAQVVHPDDFKLFGQYSIVPSVQPTHATSDMYWAGERLGKEREKSAYAFRQLMQENSWIPLGTDFPVEDISPIKTFFAAVARKDAQLYPENGYQMENALSREEALRGMTTWAAYSCFEENEKGSLEKGKLADFIILDRDLMKIPEAEILQSRVIATYLGGKKVF